MIDIKAVINAGVTMSMDFSMLVEDLFGRCELVFYKKFGEDDHPYRVVDTNLNVNEKYSDFDEAYAFFKKHLDPEVNPGMAFRAATEEVALKGGDAIDSEVLREILDTIKANGWAMKYARPKSRVPKPDKDPPATFAGLTTGDRRVLLACPKGKWFVREDVPDVAPGVGYRLKRLVKIGLVEWDKSKRYRVMKNV